MHICRFNKIFLSGHLLLFFFSWHISGALVNFPIVVSGIKPGTDRRINTAERIGRELDSLNTMKICFIIPEQGGRYSF